MFRVSYVFYGVLAFVMSFPATAQRANPVKNLFPEKTIFHENIPYAGDTLKKHLLDIYLPAQSLKGPLPVVVWIHGGAWRTNDKYADMSYMKQTVKGLIDHGYALASIDYRFSTEATFPAQIQDCHQAIAFVHTNAAKYNLDPTRIAVMGFSAGGHLASLLALSLNDEIDSFYPAGIRPNYSVRCVLDFYGPSDLIAISQSGNDESVPDPITGLLGSDPVLRPDLARAASPVSYIDKNDPPFLIIQGEKDESVPNAQSRLLSSWLRLSDVEHELIIVPDAPHYGAMFDAEWIRERVWVFLKTHL
jgi:acetyl esterase/lipase